LAIAYSPAGVLYGLVQAGTGSLYRINTTTGVATLIGNLGLTNIVEGDLAFDPTTGNLYGLQDQVGNNLFLFSINPSTGVGADIGIVAAVNGSDFSAMTEGQQEHRRRDQQRRPESPGHAPDGKRGPGNNCRLGN
jgi:hypothetical protein